ncbi:MAG: ABC transporter permease [Lachnospiraceae bacterium]|nr:ABC transporter permease [Lachnospiraceae bacterium]
MTLINWLWDIQGGATLGIIWGIMALGLYLTYRVLNYADLTVDGSLALGGAISAVCVAAGVPPILAIFIATAGGMMAGGVTGFLHTKLRIPDLLAGILTQFGLYSINLRIMGKANFGLLNQTTLFSQIKALGMPSKWAGLSVGIVFIVILIVVIYCFFGTEIGCALRATGNNPDMVKAMGSNTKAYIVLGLVVGNGLVGMSGALLAQYQGYADIQMGQGTIVIGLAAIMIGEVLFSKRSYMHRLTGVVIGSIVYRIIIAFVLRISLNMDLFIKITADDMKLITAVIVAIALVAPRLKNTAVAKTTKGGTLNA